MQRDLQAAADGGAVDGGQQRLGRGAQQAHDVVYAACRTVAESGGELADRLHDREVERSLAPRLETLHQIEHAAGASLLKKAADKDDVADQVVTMCRTETMTGQTVVIDSGRIFH